MAKKLRTYYSLLVMEPDQLWSPQFGDFDRAVVSQEGDDTKKDWPKGTKMKIISTPCSQDEIKAAIDELNANIVLRKIKAAALVEDRKEYGKDDLVRMYSMTDGAATRLEHLLRTYGDA